MLMTSLAEKIVELNTNAVRFILSSRVQVDAANKKGSEPCSFPNDQATANNRPREPENQDLRPKRRAEGFDPSRDPLWGKESGKIRGGAIQELPLARDPWPLVCSIAPQLRGTAIHSCLARIATIS